MRKTITVLLLLCATLWGAGAQGFEADSLAVTTEAPPINDYTLIGVNYGVSFATMYYSPARHNRAFAELRQRDLHEIQQDVRQAPLLRPGHRSGPRL